LLFGLKSRIEYYCYKYKLKVVKEKSTNIILIGHNSALVM
jgi:hypothetical protein